MSIAKQCDKCGKTFGEFDQSVPQTVPDLIVSVGGETILEFEDMCPTCVDKVTANTKRYLAVKSRTRSSQGEE